MSDAGMPSAEGNEYLPSVETDQDACMWAMICHLAALAGYSLLPGIGWICGPMVAWLVKKDQYPFVDEQGKEAINFQISMTIYAMACVPFCCILIGFAMLGIVGVLDIVLMIIAAVKSNAGEHYRYPLTIRFVK